MKGKNPFNICVWDEQSDCADCAIRDRLACRQGRKIMRGLRAPIESGALHSLTRTSRRFLGTVALADTCEIRICATGTSCSRRLAIRGSDSSICATSMDLP